MNYQLAKDWNTANQCPKTIQSSENLLNMPHYRLASLTDDAS